MIVRHLPSARFDQGRLLSPYAVSKASNELYAQAFGNVYELELIGLRYFNVFGPRQDPNGPYAAVIPRWMDALTKGQSCQLYGDGETTRDFCFIDNAVQANLLAGCTTNPEALGEAYNVAVGEQDKS